MERYDKIIFGAGIYGLYAALRAGRKGERVLVLEYEEQAFKRASYINQARVHMGYHYPRSYSTAIKSAKYFDRFCKDYDFCILSDFKKIYATAENFSWSNAEQFKKFCVDANIPCKDISPNEYFIENTCEGAFETREYVYDATLLKDYFLSELGKIDHVQVQYNRRLMEVKKESDVYILRVNNTYYTTPFVLNATYASINQIIEKFGFESFKIKYEICEVILCKVNKALLNVGITVMDGPFFSIMPFGNTGLHSLTSVSFTPHIASYEKLPIFQCQQGNEAYCSSEQLGNCNDCKNRPESANSYMRQLARKYLKDAYQFEYVSSLFSIKPILKASEVDDSRPTVIKKHTEKPVFVSVLSGKINTIYDLDEIL